MSKTGFVYLEEFLRHETGIGHPERPDRLRHLLSSLKESETFASLIQIRGRAGELSWIEQIHSRTYIDAVQSACQRGPSYLDSDTVVCEDSFNVAVLAVGAVAVACDAVISGEVDNAFCAVRPPGHHAERSRAMGFCLFNNVAVAAKYLQNHHTLKRVCIIDWDVHHGNGTQNAFYDDPTVFYISIHQHPLFPGTGSAGERGKGHGEGTTLNFPSTPGMGDEEYLSLFKNQIVPAVRDFQPDFILISAGFDAHRDDPLANMRVTEAGFGQMTESSKALAEECCQGRLVSLLEGGYDLNALARSVDRHLMKMQA